MEIPCSDSFVSPLRQGFLQKLTGKGWLYSGTWKKRFCVLDNSKLYYYEGEHSQGSEKSSGVINLDYFDACEESKDKKNPHVFVVGTSVRGFFENRHQFAADSTDELQSWIKSIQAAISEARVSRRKHGKKRHQDGKSSSNSSQSPSAEQMEAARQRSISLSNPLKSDILEEDGEYDSPRNSGDGKWLSQSMEEVDRQRREAGLEEEHRSSSVFDIPQQKEEPPRRAGRGGNLLGQHAALTRELEMRLKAGTAPGGRRMTSELEDTPLNEYNDRSSSSESARLDRLTHRVDTTTSALASLEHRVGQLARRVDTAQGNNHKEEEKKIGDVLLQVTVTLQEAERINAECKRALADANKARIEYQLLAKECQETLAKLAEPKQNGD